MKAVIFDMDGVIFDSERLYLKCWQAVAEKHHLENIEEVCLKTAGTNSTRTKEIFQKAYGRDFPLEQYIKEVNQAFFKEPLPLKKGAREILSALSKEHVPIALASSTEKDTVIKELNEADLLQYFNVIVTGDMVPRSKPAPDIFLKAAALLKVEPSQCFVIEDSFAGIEAAYAAGMAPLMVPDLKQPDARIRKLAKAIFPSLIETKAFLLSHQSE